MIWYHIIFSLFLNHFSRLRNWLQCWYWRKSLICSCLNLWYYNIVGVVVDMITSIFYTKLVVIVFLYCVQNNTFHILIFETKKKDYSNWDYKFFIPIKILVKIFSNYALTLLKLTNNICISNYLIIYWN